MEKLMEQIRKRLKDGAYPNEAAVSFSILVPLLQGLGWDSANPEQVAPEFTSGRGRVDFALCLAGRRPAVFIEVKAVGRSLEGDRQLFEYAFHEGVPLCVLTDGREWSFYLPSGQGNYEDRRVYRLQLDERTPAESAEVFRRYLAHDRVKSGQAREDAVRDYQNASARREAARALPQAWAELIDDSDDLLIDLLADRAEAICGFRPGTTEVIKFLKHMPDQALSPRHESLRL
jgi:predicted type IV restriction endonuclease